MRNWRDDFTLDFDSPVYISFDMDALDPAFAPGVSHREPGGLSTRQAIGLIQRLRASCRGRHRGIQPAHGPGANHRSSLRQALEGNCGEDVGINAPWVPHRAQTAGAHGGTPTITTLLRLTQQAGGSQSKHNLGFDVPNKSGVVSRSFGPDLPTILPTAPTTLTFAESQTAPETCRAENASPGK